MSLLPPPAAHAPLPRDSRNSLDDLEEGASSSQGPGLSGEAAPEASNAPEDWKTRGLLHTVKAGDDDEVQRLIGRVDTRLHAAARAQDLAALRALLGAGAAPDALDWEGRTPLHLCVALRLMEPFMVLLSVPGSADARDASGWPLLHAALLHGWRAGARAALTAGARVDATGPGRFDMLDINPEYFSDPGCYMNRYPKVKWTVFFDSLPRTAIEVAMIHDMEMFPAMWLKIQPDMEAPLINGASPHQVSDKKKNDTAPEDGLATEPIAVYSKEPESVELLPDKRTSTQVETVDANTPLNSAPEDIRGTDGAAETVLEIETGENGTKPMMNAQTETPLSGASPHKDSGQGDTALHAAIHDPHTLKYLLDNTDVQNSLNSEGLAPEHCAVYTKNTESLKLLLDKFNSTLIKTGDGNKNTLLHLAAMRGGDEEAKIILERESGETGLKAMLEVNAQGHTPLHLAAKHNNRKMTALLLLNGANFSTKTEDDDKTTVVELISSNFYKADNFFELLFDGFIYNQNILDKNYIHADYEVLTDGGDMSQIKVLEEFVRCGRSEALIHPLVESLLYLKWKHFQPLFFALLVIYGIFLVSFNSLMIYIFYPEDKGNNSTVETNSSSQAASDEETPGPDGFHGGVYWLLIVLTYISIFILVVQESMFVYLKRSSYFASVESWVKLCGLVLCAGAPLAALAPGAWPRHAACAALLLAWLQAMFLVSRVSRWGYYVLMFGKVAVNILKILVTTIFLAIAFAFCFMIQYQSTPPFDGPFSAFVKTLLMMSSVFDYEDLFGDDHKEQLQYRETVAIVLMNFMTAVAVSNISNLDETGNIRRLEKQVELLSTFESLAYDGFLAKWFIKLFGDRKYHSSMYTSRGNQSTWHVEVRKPPYTKCFKDNVRYEFQIRSSKLYNAIVETPSKQDQADQEARRHNTERPYRSQMNALNALADKPAGSGQRGLSIDLIDRKINNFNSLVFKQHLGSLANNSSKHSRDIEVLKQGNALLNLQINRLTAISSDVLRSVKAGPNWTSLARRSRRPRRRAAHRTRSAEDELFPSFLSQEDPFLAPSTNRGPFDFLSSKW